jgi:uncharacterized protein
VSKVVHFEIQADDLERAKSFYRNAFGWDYQDFSPPGSGMTYWGVIAGPEDAPGINGGLLPRSAPAPSPGAGVNAFVCTIEVGDYDSVHARILAAGGDVAMPKTALTGMAWQGYYIDTEGNTFGIHQPDDKAGL